MSTTAIHRLDPAQFLKAVAAPLEESEAENNLVLGIATQLVARPDLIKASPFLAMIEEDGGLAGAAVMTPPHPLVISRTGACGIAELVDHLDAAGIRPPGVNGHAGTARMLAGLWGSRIGETPVPGMEMRIYELKAVIPPPAVPGRLREATPADEGLVARWRRGFIADAHLDAETEDRAREAAKRLIEEKRQFVWEDGVPRCMAVWSRPTAHGTCISGVYTPPEFRRQGYATSCVAALSRHLLDAGRRFTCLFTDQSNPTSNDIYMKIGYRPVCDLASFTFRPGR
ncbi:MAG: GNAT family N-acetyltransferase [Candidatus Coatesbacteria bacterium]